MTKKPDFDLSAAHKYFSGDCFNKAWELLNKPDRTAEEDEQMLRLSLASHWHWTQREDCTPTSISVAHWQTARIYAVLGQAENARRYAQMCLAASQGDDIPPFYLGYAYEALARAELAVGDRGKMEEYLEEAQRTADSIDDPDEKKWLLDDLGTIK
jgi:tetratricopeptide (TPR) repeat protein